MAFSIRSQDSQSDLQARALRLSVTEIDRQLRGMPGDLDGTALSRETDPYGWPKALLERFPETLNPAAVLMPLIERRAGVTLLLTRRSAQLRHHAGQVSFPGGSREPSDASLRETAVRETWEEVGIAPQQVRVSGYLPAMRTVTGFSVTPVIGMIELPVELRLDPREVDDAFEVPLEHFLDARNERWSEREIHGVAVPVVEFSYGGQRIWGATAAMIVALGKRLSR